MTQSSETLLPGQQDSVIESVPMNAANTIGRMVTRIAELERQNADLQKANNAYLQRARDAEDVLRRSGSGLKFLYEIREALGWNDKTSLSIMPDGIKELRRERDAARRERDAAAEAERTPGWPFA